VVNPTRQEHSDWPLALPLDTAKKTGSKNEPYAGFRPEINHNLLPLIFLLWSDENVMEPQVASRENRFIGGTFSRNSMLLWNVSDHRGLEEVAGVICPQFL
jgi:hypothetical protein